VIAEQAPLSQRSHPIALPLRTIVLPVRRGGDQGKRRPRTCQSVGKTPGRRPISHDVVERIRAELVTGAGILKTAKTLGLGTGTVHRVKREMANALT
jgi:hypothetical protein